ncbi:hypothetical protein GCM10007913_07320 [Devosia yakushimensis]|uniref:Uncharacterized protein n=1 Tax=Devosia yakushimensis TaxID=470028 RepID=A0ABQ5UC87_9HYPH|nr:hypothetical protein [Devosia yakushimensis]GLQ08800.1 hypothetical protein GCM10007913_07320 [Devosia yakushimensis]
MGLVLYLFGAVIFVLVVGWAVYVLPTPGPLGPASLATALIPVGIIVGSVFATVLLAWLLLVLARALFRIWRHLTRSS